MSDGDRTEAGRFAAVSRWWRKARTLAVAVPTIAAAFWAVFQYLDQRGREEAANIEIRRQEASARIEQAEREIRNHRRESQKPFLEKQLAHYFEAARVAAIVATAPIGPFDVVLKDLQNVNLDSPGRWSAARLRFWELYWGELAVVESTEVARAMAAFGSKLREMEACIEESRDRKLCVELQRQLPSLSIRIAHEGRKSIEQSWEIKLGDLPAGRVPQ